MTLEHLCDDGQVSRKPAVVGVEEGDDLAAGERDAGVASGARATILLPVVAQAGVEPGQRFARAVGRAVIDHDQLEVRELRASTLRTARSTYFRRW